MKMTSAYANKLLRQLNEEKEFLLNQEENSCTYVYAADEEPLIPQYSYPQTEAQLRALDAKIVKIKHAELQQRLHQPDAKQRARADG